MAYLIHSYEGISGCSGIAFILHDHTKCFSNTGKILTVLGMNLDKQSDSCMIVKDHTRTYIEILQDHVAKICFNFLTQSCKILATYL